MQSMMAVSVSLMVLATAIAAQVTFSVASFDNIVSQVAFTLVILYLYMQNRYWNQIESSFQGPPIAIDKSRGILGMIGSILSAHLWDLSTAKHIPFTGQPDLLEVFTRYQDVSEAKGEGCYRLWVLHPLIFLSRPIIVVHDPDLISEILCRESYGLWDKGKGYRISSPLIGTGALLSVEDGIHWKHQRKLMNSGFHVDLMKRAHVIVEECISRLANKWDYMPEGQTIELVDDMLKLTMDVLGLAAFSYDFNSVSAKSPEDAPLFMAFDTILKILTNRSRGIKQVTTWLPTTENRRFNFAIKRMDNMTETIIAQRLNKTQSSEQSKTKAGENKSVNINPERNRNETDILDKLLLKDDDGKAMSTSLIKNNIKTLLFAGHDTTASALSWAIYFISMNREIESRMLAEFATLSDSKKGDEYHHLERLPYLNAVIKEVLRVRPSAGFTREAASRSGQCVGKYYVPSGAEIYFLPILIHNNPKYWDEPDAFKPERWLLTCSDDNNSKPADQSGKYFPFSLGMRNCVGRMLALAELRAGLKFLLQRYKFTPLFENNQEEPQVIMLMTFCPSRIPMKVEKR